MKKAKVLVLVLALMMLFVASAQAITISSVSSDGKVVKWTVSGSEGPYTAYVDGTQLVNTDHSSASFNKTLDMTKRHLLKVVDTTGAVDEKWFPDVLPTAVPTAAPTAEPTEEPTEAPTAEPTEAPTEEPTEAPTAEPTEVPTTEPTEAPVNPTKAPVEPTEAPEDTDDDTDDVPKTGDFTMAYVLVLISMLVLACGSFVAVARKK